MSTLRRVLVDGGSGAGKTTFARDLCELWRRESGLAVQLVSLDELYPGWHGLAEGSRMVVDDVLRAVDPGYRRWDWERNRPAEWVPLRADRPMVVEGCGAITRAAVPLVDLAIWMELDEPTRKRRALGRADGAGYAPWWDTWSRQEHAHWRADDPRALAHVVIEVSGAARSALLKTV